MTEEPPSQDWYLREWMQRMGKRQADLVRELGWMKNTAHKVWHGRQPYRREIVNEVAAWLRVEPYELLMHPEVADGLRRLRGIAEQIVAEPEQPLSHDIRTERGKR